MKALIYIRVSHEEQKEGLSLDNQLERCLKFCDFKGLEVVDIIRDEGVSGYKTEKRKGFKEMLGAIRGRKCDAIVVHSLSRFCRNTIGTLTTIEEMTKNDIAFYSLTENIDTSSAAGKMFLTMVSAFAEFERNVTSERIKSVFEGKRERKEALGSIPYGFRKEGKNLVVDERESEVVEIVIRAREAGKSFAGISAELEQKGYKPRTGIRFHSQMISNILLNSKKGIYKIES